MLHLSSSGCEFGRRRAGSSGKAAFPSAVNTPSVDNWSADGGYSRKVELSSPGTRPETRTARKLAPETRSLFPLACYAAGARNKGRKGVAFWYQTEPHQRLFP